jgi:hypothetical protein
MVAITPIAAMASTLALRPNVALLFHVEPALPRHDEAAEGSSGESKVASRDHRRLKQGIALF